MKKTRNPKIRITTEFMRSLFLKKKPVTAWGGASSRTLKKSEGWPKYREWPRALSKKQSGLEKWPHFN
jgi:hypothetical protein